MDGIVKSNGRLTSGGKTFLVVRSKTALASRAVEQAAMAYGQEGAP